MKCALILLAAGNSTRMGQPKQLLPFRGRTLLQHSIENGLASLCRPVVVVLGANAAEITPSLSGLPIETIVNPGWEGGMGTSIGAGVAAAASHDVEGLIIALADQPMVSADIYNRLVERCESTARPIVTSEYAGTVGVPVLFTRAYFADLLALRPEQGCKGLIIAHNDSALRIPCPEAEVDIDTPSDLHKLSGSGLH